MQKIKINTSAVSQVWFTADLHGLHKNICYGTSVWDNKEENCRMFNNPNEMTDTIVNNFNKLVKSDDLLFMLGDLLFHYKDPESYNRFINRFNCNNIYVLYGNHCHRDNLWAGLSKNDKVKIIGDYLEIEIDGKLVCMFHYPIARWNNRHKDSYMLFGHEHGGFDNGKNSLDVGIDNYFKLYKEYRPFNWGQIKQILK